MNQPYQVAFKIGEMMFGTEFPIRVEQPSKHRNSAKRVNKAVVDPSEWVETDYVTKLLDQFENDYRAKA